MEASETALNAISNRALVVRHIVVDVDLAGDDVRLGGFGGLLGLGRQDCLVPLVLGIADAIVLQALKES
jgi:hypothetical protein